MTLSKLRHGDRAVIVSIDTDDPHTMTRLAARGIVPGCNVDILCAGDPILIDIDDDRWAINSAEAAQIRVETVAEPRRSLLSFLHRT